MSQESHPIKKNQNFFQLLVLIFIVGIFVGLDLLTKYILSSSSFFNGERLNLLPFLDIYVTQNSGIAFSIFDYDQYWLSLTISIIGLGIVIYFASLALREKHLIKRVSLFFIIGGAMGNIIDRMLDGQVIDFLLFYPFNYPIFIFNVADALITIGAITFIVSEIILLKSSSE